MRCCSKRATIQSSSQSLGIGNQTALRGPTDDGFERSARHYDIGYARIHDLAIAAVAEDEPIIGIIEREAFGNALDCVDEALARLRHVTQILLLDLKCGVAKQPECLRHSANLVAARERQRRSKVPAGDGKHALTHARQTGEQAPVDVKPDNQH